MNRFLLFPVLLLLSFQSYSQWTQVAGSSDGKVIIENDSVILLSATASAYTATSLSGPWTSVGLPGVVDYVEVGDSVYIVQDAANPVRSQFSDFNNTATFNSGGGIIDYKENVILAGAYVYGFYYSEDEGQSWMENNSGLPEITGGAGGPYVMISDVTHSDQYVFTAITGNGAGIYRTSTHTGQWVQKSNGLPSINPLYGLLKCIDEILYTSYAGGLYTSTDFGENWSLMYDAPSHIKAIEKSGNMILLGTENSGVHASIDNGLTWSSINYGLGLGLEIYDIANYKDTLLCTNDNGFWMLPASILDQELSLSEPSVTDHSVHVYPNPSKGKFSIQFTNQSSESVEITITDLSGREFYKSFHSSSSVEINQLLEVGVYIVNVSGIGYSSTVKIIVE